MGAGTDSSWSNNVNEATLRQMDEAMPGGAHAFQQYHQSQLLAAALVKFVIKKTGLEKYVNPSDLMNSQSRNSSANNLMNELIRQGRVTGDGGGVGLTMLAQNVAARATGDSTLTPAVQILNVSGQDYTYDIFDHIAKPVAPKQSASPTMDISKVNGKEVPTTGAEAHSESEKSLAQQLLDLFTNLLKDAGKFALDERWRKAWDLFQERGPALTRVSGKILNASGLPKGAAKFALESASNLIKIIPVAGNFLSAYEAVTGTDWLTGETLSAADRILSTIGIIPGANVLTNIAREAKEVAAVARVAEIGANSKVFQLLDNSAFQKSLVAGSALVSDSAKDLNAFLRKNAFDSSAQQVYGSMLDFNEHTKEVIMKDLQFTSLTLPWQKETLGTLNMIKSGKLPLNFIHQ